MEGSKRYYKTLDFIRLVACISILFYHLGMIKGGYLAVCTFFTLSGYLSYVSAHKKDKFSLLKYYKDKFIRIYLPLIIVVFITIFVISLFPNINWLNLKPETNSVIFGYNNFWQLNANLDYFARHVSSPFIHFWYISILMQFDLAFPFIFMLLRKINEKTNSFLIAIVLIVISSLSAIYFYKYSLSNNMMMSYYNTFSRIFSLLYGLTIGYIHCNYNALSLFKNNKILKFLIYFLMLILMYMFVVIDAKSSYYQIAMLITTLITCKLIDYSVLIEDKQSKTDKIVKSLSSISYEIYLIQYPVIFLLQELNVLEIVRIPLVILITIILSYILHFSLSKATKLKILKYLVFIIFIGISLYGGKIYINTADHTAEMKALEEQLIENEKMIEARQKEYLSSLKEEEDSWNLQLKNLEDDADSLLNNVTNFHIVGVGDSVMLGAVPELYKVFPNGYFDAKISRTAWVVNDILKNLDSKGLLKEPILLNLGANGDCTDKCKEDILKTCNGRKVFWVNTTNDKDVHVNGKLELLAKTHDNLYIIDWNKLSRGHSDYFVADKIHLTEIGKKAYSKIIYDAIYNVYLKEYEDKKDSILKEHENQLKNKITFLGNDILLNSFKYVEKEFNNADVVIEKDYKNLKKEIIKGNANKTLNNKIAFVLDDSINLSEEEYKDLIKLCKNHEVYIFSTDNDVDNLEDISAVNLKKQVENFEDYLMPDKIHLNEEGNKKVAEILKLLKKNNKSIVQ